MQRTLATSAMLGRIGRVPVRLCVRANSSAKNAFGSSLPEVVAAHGWDGAWQKQVTPWDVGKPAPMVERLCKSGSLPPGPVLVPGCGAGYDAFAFAAAGRETLGMDLSRTAVERCKHLLTHAPEYAGISKDKLAFRLADFFTFAPSRPFGVVFDYTFMSALPPSMWPAWAKTMKHLISPTGQLITLMFPVGNFEGGPPFAVQPEKVRDMIIEAGFECVELSPVPKELSHKARAGREYLGRFQHNASRYPILRTPVVKVPPPRKGK